MNYHIGDQISVYTIAWPNQIQELTDMVDVLQKKIDNCMVCNKSSTEIVCPRGYIRSALDGQCERGVTCELSPCEQ